MLKLVTFGHTLALEAADHLRTNGLRREEGQTMAEYAVVLAVITAAIITVLVTLSGSIRTKLSDVAGIITNNGSAPAGS